MTFSADTRRRFHASEIIQLSKVRGLVDVGIVGEARETPQWIHVVW